MTWFETFVAELYRPIDRCPRCFHDMDSHERIMGKRACNWCNCGHRKLKV